jgi:hypothetical protein
MPELTFKEKNLRTVVMNAMTALIVDANKKGRESALVDLLGMYRETGNKSFSVFSPQGDKVATITLNESAAEPVVTDGDALLEWCRVHRPELVETVEHPPVEAWTETKLTGAAVAHILEDAKLADTSYVTEGGELVDGLEFKPAEEPSKFTVTYAAKDRGLSLVQSWRDGGIPLQLDPNLPMIGGAA